MKYKLKVIVASTRPGRKGISVAKWLMNILEESDAYEFELIDLKEVNLPFLDESAHPRLREYTHDHTKRWSQTIDEADAFIVVTAEYNHNPPPPLINALDFLHQEWADKPLGFVSYGGVSAGTRAVDKLLTVVTTLGMMPIPQAVHIPFVSQFMDENGHFNGNEISENAARTMLRELLRWTKALKEMRIN